MKTVIINPPWTVKKGFGCRTNSRWPHIRKDKHLAFPIYLAYTSALLKENDIDVTVIDCIADELDKKKLNEIIKKEKFDLCFFETSTPTIKEDLETVKFIKENNNTKVYLFGAHVTFFHDTIIKENNFIDGIIRGEFELTIKEICLKKALSEIEGLSYRINDEIIINKNRINFLDVNEIPFPDWGAFNLSYYDSFLNKSPSMMIIASRGCPFGCTYCLWPHQLYGKKQRLRTPESICDEIEILIKRYDIKEIKFDDDTFALNPNFVKKVCYEMIRRNINKKIVWNCFGHCSQTDAKMYQLMRKAGCVQIAFGVESASEQMLKRINKHLDLKKINKTIEICKKAGIKTYCDFIIGFPYETKADIFSSINLALTLDVDFIQVSYNVPYPGTPMYSEMLQKNMLRYPTEWQKYASTGILIKNEKISLAEYKKIYQLFWLSFYLRPSYILKTLKEIIRDTSILKQKLKGFYSFAKRFIL